MLSELIKYFKNTPEEQIKSDWDKTKEWDKIGPTVHEFLKSINSEPQIEARSVRENEQKKEVCDCKIPYFPTGDKTWCSRCYRETVY